ncbi:MAG: hypothetical protein ACK5HP_03640 [Bacilli bacterium]
MLLLYDIIYMKVSVNMDENIQKEIENLKRRITFLEVERARDKKLKVIMFIVSIIVSFICILLYVFYISKTIADLTIFM